MKKDALWTLERFFGIQSTMHEMSLMSSVMDIACEEMAAHGATRLLSLKVRYGALSNVVPEAMRMAFDAMVAGTAHEGARLDLEEEALKVRCHACSHVFVPEGKNAVFGYCPGCREVTSYQVEEGSGIFLDKLEAE